MTCHSRISSKIQMPAVVPQFDQVGAYIAAKHPKRSAIRKFRVICICIVASVGISALFGSIGNLRRETYQHSEVDEVSSGAPTLYLHANSKSVSMKVTPSQARNASISLTDYWSLPLETFGLVEMAYGLSVKYKGSYPGKGVLVDVAIPQMDLGVATLRPVATCVAYRKNHAVVIESTKVTVYTGSGHALKGVDFKMYSEISWTDIPSKEALHFRASVTLSGSMHVVLPKAMIESIGNRAMKATIDFMAYGFLRSFKEDYEKWTRDDQYRKVRSVVAK